MGNGIPLAPPVHGRLYKVYIEECPRLTGFGLFPKVFFHSRGLPVKGWMPCARLTYPKKTKKESHFVEEKDCVGSAFIADNLVEDCRIARVDSPRPRLAEGKRMGIRFEVRTGVG